jgi:hypothetical protein
MTHEAIPPDAIIQRMHNAKTVYRLDATELARLHDVGVADPVINYMQQTYLEAIRREQTRIDANELARFGSPLW